MFLCCFRLQVLSLWSFLKQKIKLLVYHNFHFEGCMFLLYILLLKRVEGLVRSVLMRIMHQTINYILRNNKPNRLGWIEMRTALLNCQNRTVYILIEFFLNNYLTCFTT